MTRHFLIFGPPAAGKGTQAHTLKEHLEVPHVSTGDMFRANIQGGTDLGKEVQSLLASGTLVPDSLTNRLVADRLHQADVADGVLLDGFPRNVPQAAWLDGFLAELFAGFKSRGLLENTLFVMMGDHGEGFGEHGLFQHDETTYEEGLRVPLIVAGADSKASSSSEISSSLYIILVNVPLPLRIPE